MKKKLIFILIILISLGVFTGCYDSLEVDDQAYVIAMGLDKGKISKLKMTLQYANANALSPNGGNNTVKGNVFNVSAESITVAGGLNEMNSFIGKQLDVSHALLLVFSEELAREGIAAFLRGATRNRDFRPTMYVAISRGNAEDFIKAINPTLETDPSKYYQLLFSAFSHTGYSIESNIFNFYGSMVSNSVQSTANLVGVNKYTSSKDFTDETSTYQEKGHTIPFVGDSKAGDIPRVGEPKSEVMGVAVFSGDKFVGELDGEDAMLFQMITGDFNRAVLTVPDPKVPSKYVILNIKKSRKPMNEVDITSSKPKIQSKIQLEGDITIIQSDYNYEDLKNLPILESSIEAFLEKDIEYLVNKTINEYQSDIFGFGKVVQKKFLTIKEWEAYHWLKKYGDSEFSVEVDMKIRRPGLKLHTSPIISSEGKESSK